MIGLLFLLTAIVYSAYAYLPFLNLSAKWHYPAGAAFAVLGSILWVTISRSIAKDQIAIFGAYFDMIITMAFLAVPLILTGFSIGMKQGIGITLMLIGMAITKF